MAANDLLTLDEAKRAVHIDLTDATRDDLLAQYVTAVSRLLDDRIGPTVRRTVTSEEHHEAKWRCTIVLRHRPVTSVASISEYQDTTPTALTVMSLTSHPTDGVLLEPYEPETGLYNGIVHRTAGDRVTRFQGPVAVTYTAGRVASTTTVEARIKRAAGICLENLWGDQQQSATTFGEYDVPAARFPGFVMPRAVEQLLSEELGQHEPWGIA